jgi:hypothetical protein
MKIEPLQVTVDYVLWDFVVARRTLTIGFRYILGDEQVHIYPRTAAFWAQLEHPVRLPLRYAVTVGATLTCLGITI